MQQNTAVADFGAGVAIIGMSCILPGGINSPEALWKFLCEGREGISEVPKDRWNNDAVYDSDPGTPGRTSTRRGGFVADIAAFDAAFFGISPREAAVMDPQQRMLLETAWLALEDAGVPMEKLSGSRTGVYVGISHSDYHGIQKFGRPEIDVHTSTGGALSIAANRLSHRFNLRGPSLSVDTACSSSLVALDLACTALRNGECETALVGGANAILTPDVTITFSRASMLSPDGRCKAFDARANGYVRGEGAAMVVLKPLARALADGDRVHAVIRATAVNQDGQTTTITVPSMQAQIEMLQEVCRRGAIDPSQIGYVEAHGTGTPVGDPIEAEAIGTVFGRPRPGISPCLLGSIKTNIGHLEPAAGIAGLIKATLCVRNGRIPPHLHFETPNPNIRFQELGIQVCRELTPFPDRAINRVAAVNSFGFGGTNACAIVQQPPSRLTDAPAEGHSAWPVLLAVSAANRNSLEALAGEIAATLADERVAFADAAGTLALRRSHLEHRAVAIAKSRDDAVAQLRSFARKEAHAGVISGRRRGEARTAFVFTGQGAHWWAMGRRLMQHDPVFRKAVEECDKAFRALSGTSIVAELMASQEKSRLDHTSVAQPATFALQLGLAARWKAWGIVPGAVIGHSIGEMAAACVAGALQFRRRREGRLSSQPAAGAGAAAGRYGGDWALRQGSRKNPGRDAVGVGDRGPQCTRTRDHRRIEARAGTAAGGICRFAARRLRPNAACRLCLPLPADGSVRGGAARGAWRHRFALGRHAHVLDRHRPRGRARRTVGGLLVAQHALSGAVPRRGRVGNRQGLQHVRGTGRASGAGRSGAQLPRPSRTRRHHRCVASPRGKRSRRLQQGACRAARGRSRRRLGQGCPRAMEFRRAARPAI